MKKDETTSYKTLFLLRHASAAPAGPEGDFERQLSPAGRDDANALAFVMEEKSYVPQSVLCSPATRTKQTLEALQMRLGRFEVRKPKILYSGTAGDYFSQILMVKASCQKLLLIAHNPGLHKLAQLLIGAGEPEILSKLQMGYNAGALCVLSCPCESWSSLQPGQNEMIDFLDPGSFNMASKPTRWT